MATQSKVTEPATPSEAPESVTEPAIPDTVPGRELDPRKRVHVYDTVTGEKQPHPVPETWLDGRFPRLAETPSKKAGK